MSSRRSQVRSLWDTHDENDQGYLDETQLERLLIHLQQKLGGAGDLSAEAVKRCAEVLHADEETGELRQEVFGRRFTHLWAQKEELLELAPKVDLPEDTPNSTVDLPEDTPNSTVAQPLKPPEENPWLTATMKSLEDTLSSGYVCWAQRVVMEDEEQSQKQASLSPSGPVQLLVLERSNERLRVRDQHGNVGWVKSSEAMLHSSPAFCADDSFNGHAMKLWHGYKLAQAQGADLASELIAAHHHALQKAGEFQVKTWHQQQEIQQLKEVVKMGHALQEEVEASMERRVLDLRQKEEQMRERDSELMRAKSQLADSENQAGRLRLELEDTRAAAAARKTQQLHTEEQQESRMAAMAAVMQEEVNRAHERLTMSEMAASAAHIQMQVLEDDEAAKIRKSADELGRMKEYARAESVAFDECEFKLESLEKREKTRALFENVQVEFSYKEKRANDELREATLLRNEAAQAADEALALRMKLAREDHDVTSRQASIAAAEQQASQKLESAALELDKARKLTQDLNKDKAEALSELTEAKRVSMRAREERELAHQQSIEAEMAAYEAVKACEATDEDRRKVEQSLLLVTEDLEKAARQHRDGLQLAAKGESSLRSVRSLEALVSQYTEENKELCKVLASERAACSEFHREKERMQHELRDLSRLTRFASRSRIA